MHFTASVVLVVLQCGLTLAAPYKLGDPGTPEPLAVQTANGVCTVISFCQQVLARDAVASHQTKNRGYTATYVPHPTVAHCKTRIPDAPFTSQSNQNQMPLCTAELACQHSYPREMLRDVIVKDREFCKALGVETTGESGKKVKRAIPHSPQPKRRTVSKDLD